MSDLEQVIADSVNDSINGVEVETPDVEASSEPVEASESASDTEPVAEDGGSLEVSSPATQEAVTATPTEPQDEFAKLAGMSQVGVGGRENRIPYSRVKKITEKAATEAENRAYESVLGRKLNPGEKGADILKAELAKIPEYTAKVTDYESRLSRVGEFEDVLANNPQQFLTMLAKLPAYREFFEFVQAAAEGTAGSREQITATSAPDDMPEPDEILPDGSRVYSLEGLKSLLAWNANATESRVTSKYETRIKELENRFGPVASHWQEQQRIAAVAPVIQKKLEEARTWPLFNESEEEILAVLTADKKISLEGAYNKVVMPKLIAERNKVRQEVLAEVKAAPTATSVTSRTVGTKPNTQPSGNRSLEDIIKEQVETLKR